jgi:acyl-CoA synthetase (AMP-forming)/AMP-acid ligase II
VGCAVVVAGEGRVVACEALEGLCRELLAGYKMPRRFILRAAPLPRTASGKIKKFELRQETLSADPKPSSEG